MENIRCWLQSSNNEWNNSMSGMSEASTEELDHDVSSAF